jgi:hypothetical protein
MTGPTRERRFVLRVYVSNELWRDDEPMARAMAHDLLDKIHDLRGPRGGRYVAVGEPFDYRDGELRDDFMYNRRMVVAYVMGRYVRPKR